jgi:hypothetical protein
MKNYSEGDIKMLKNRLIPAFVLAGLVGVAACERQEETRIETTPATEAPVAEPAPMTQDPAMMDPMYDDTLHVDTLHTMPHDTL